MKPGTVEAARLCAEEALTPLHGVDGLLTHPFTEAKRNMARQRLLVAAHALAGALASLEAAEIEPPFTAPPTLTLEQLNRLTPRARSAAYLQASDAQRAAWRTEAALAGARNVVPLTARKARR